MSTFKDNFSSHAATYAEHRVSYPPELFEFLSTQIENHQLVWDCGTGNGQAAVQLAQFFEKVYATDPSAAQIENAFLRPNIEFKVEKAEDCSLPDHSADLITVAQALHWFNFESFYKQVNRVLKPGGVFAAWCYDRPHSDDKRIDEIIAHMHDNIVGPFWQQENLMVEREYIDIPFPFREIETPAFEIREQWTTDRLLGHLNSWSATQRFIKAGNVDPMPALAERLQSAVQAQDQAIPLRWKLVVKAGRI